MFMERKGSCLDLASKLKKQALLKNKEIEQRKRSDDIYSINLDQESTTFKVNQILQKLSAPNKKNPTDRDGNYSMPLKQKNH